MKKTLFILSLMIVLLIGLVACNGSKTVKISKYNFSAKYNGGLLIETAMLPEYATDTRCSFTFYGKDEIEWDCIPLAPIQGKFKVYTYRKSEGSYIYTILDNKDMGVMAVMYDPKLGDVLVVTEYAYWFFFK